MKYQNIAFTIVAATSICTVMLLVGQRCRVNDIVLFILVVFAGIVSSTLITKKLEQHHG